LRGWRLQIASMKGRRPLNRPRGDLNRRSSRLKRIFFEVPLGAIKFDWHPIGISTSDRSNICRPNAVYCDAQDWETLKEEMWSTFGSRIFLIENLDLHDLKDRYLIEFGEPYVQVIPEIGLSDDHQ
jgi:hypothetical protein